MTSTPSNVAKLHRKPEEERHHDIHPSVSPHTSDFDIHRLAHSSRHPSYTSHATARKDSGTEKRSCTHPTLLEKIQGIKDELQGKITRNPELVQHGKDLLHGSVYNESGHGPHDPVPGNKDVLDEQHQDRSNSTSKA
ncbi:hypothetical protein JR316_0006239 [Psilocybe cubensis]|uniref:Uncharacterized protein n=2 Tax=Psilocybe cubensis TaxID=181762 RepID=A0A8H8CMY5_PSICU|nr:hypothetical protein JR316_0006239 [Psilocybe cubensis]KAH9481712.1 hypothetical protein JR316_0006239 [Psilocybe cubensis]